MAQRTDHRRQLDREILSLIPMLRAVARLRTSTPAEGDALVKATLERALAERASLSAGIEPSAWLLALQRAVVRAAPAHPPQPRPDDAAGLAPAPSGAAALRGASAPLERLRLALLDLPDDFREALILADGAALDTGALALALGCERGTAQRLVHRARFALLARLGREAAPSTLPGRARTMLRRPGAAHHHGRRSRHQPGLRRQRGDTVEPRSGQRLRQRPRRPACRPHGDFAASLSIALYRLLLNESRDDRERRSFACLITRLANATPLPATMRRRGTVATSHGVRWLRLLFASAFPGTIDGTPADWQTSAR